MSVKGLERLVVWQKAREFTLQIHKEVLPIFPPEEKWALMQQLRRAAQSIPANIAEGYGRYYFQDNVRFCYIARGSLEESLSCLILAYDLGYIPERLFSQLALTGEELTKLINGYIAYLKKSKRGETEPGADLEVRENSGLYNPDFYDVEIES